MPKLKGGFNADGSDCRTRSYSYSKMSPKSFNLNPTLLTTSASTNNLALYASTNNAIIGTGVNAGVSYGLPVAGSVGYTVVGGEIYPGIFVCFLSAAKP